MTVNLSKTFGFSLEKLLMPFFEKLKPYVTFNPEDKLQSKEKAEQELFDLLSAKPLRERFDRGFESIVDQLLTLVSPKEFELVRMEWRQAVEKIVTIFKVYQDSGVLKDIDGEKFDILQELLGISDTTLNLFYKCGCNLYDRRRFQEASDVFFVVAFLNAGRSNPWISMGLAAKQTGNIEEALRSFAMASIADPHSAIPQIYAAESYIEVQQFREAVAALELAAEIARDNPNQNNPKMHNYINELILRYKQKI